MFSETSRATRAYSLPAGAATAAPLGARRSTAATQVFLRRRLSIGSDP
jgi:hypothetical protein